MIVVAATVGADPVTGLFVPASTLAAVGVLSLLTAGSWAAGRFFAAGGGAHEGRLIRIVAPVLGVVAGATVLAVMLAHLDRLLGVAPGAWSTRMIPALIAAVALVGVGWALWLRRHRPDVYAGIGRGTRPAGRLDPRLAELSL
jgi:hypothetical protein